MMSIQRIAVGICLAGGLTLAGGCLLGYEEHRVEHDRDRHEQHDRDRDHDNDRRDYHEHGHDHDSDHRDSGVMLKIEP